MKSLFLKIFLSFWVAHALFILSAIAVTLAFRPTRGSWESLRGRALNESVQAYLHGGPEQAREYLDQLSASQHIRVFLFDDKGRELTDRPAPPWAYDLAKGMPAGPRGFPWSFMPGRFLSQATVAQDGHRYILALELPPGPRVFFGPRGFPGMGLLIAVLCSGLVCYVLAHYLAAPIVRLRAATQELAAGDLSARAGTRAMRRQDEIGELVRDFDTMAERLESLVNAQSHLLNDVSHELRSPLARLNVALGLARRRAGPETQGALERIELEAERLNELIGRLLTLARLEGGEEGISKLEIALEELVREVAQDADFEAQSRNCRVSYVVNAKCTVLGNPALLRSAIENVVCNAARYTREGTGVEITLDRADRMNGAEAVLRILDSGPGVPEESLEKLFRPFYRLDDARNRQTGGVGLGLAITERTVRLHGGSVTAANRAEGGLAVEIRLPIVSVATADSPGVPVPERMRTA
ncbi:MAG TPA: ATP-binding protein [Terriglobales bacterium]|nr:ATP-binding protein [Terriglobales bacterium]